MRSRDCIVYGCSRVAISRVRVIALVETETVVSRSPDGPVVASVCAAHEHDLSSGRWLRVGRAGVLQEVA